MLNLFQRLFEKNNLSDEDKKLCQELNHALGFIPKNITLYKQALLHRSAAYLQPQNHKANNERLEFLGDSVLDVVVATFLFKKFPKEKEGFLTKLRSKIVSRNSLNSVSVNLGIDVLLKTNNLKGTANHMNIYGNALEALIGATYLDKGFDFTKKFIIGNIIEKHINLTALQNEDIDSKSKFIEYCQKHRTTIEFVSTEDSHTPKQAPKFTSSLLANGRRLTEGHGQSKKDAEQNAAKLALELVEQQGLELQ